MGSFDAVIVGAGQAGLATAYVMRHRGLRPLVVEAGSSPTGSWGRGYDSLMLFSPARYSALPGLRFPGDPDRYPARDEVAAYLRAYADRLDVPIELNTRVTAVRAAGTGLRVVTDAGAEFVVPLVVSAAGGFPYRPPLPGLDTFTGTMLHASQYHQPEPFTGQRVMVVGAGNSAVQIAAELAQVATVTLTSRAPVRFLPQRPFGADLHAWLHYTGIERLPLGRWMRNRTMSVLDTGRYRAAIRAQRPDWRPMFTRLTPDGVVWTDGRVEPMDTVVLATGYRPHVTHLAECAGPDGRSAVDPDGSPRHRAGVSSVVAGLGFVGLEGQRGIASATLRGVGRDAAYVVRRLTSTARQAALGVR